MYVRCVNRLLVVSVVFSENLVVRNECNAIGCSRVSLYFAKSTSEICLFVRLKKCFTGSGVSLITVRMLMATR